MLTQLLLQRIGWDQRYNAQEALAAARTLLPHMFYHDSGVQVPSPTSETTNAPAKRCDHHLLAATGLDPEGYWVNPAHAAWNVVLDWDVYYIPLDWRYRPAEGWIRKQLQASEQSVGHPV